MLKKFLKSLQNQKGQSLALYALLVPLLFTAGGTAVDLGWYYMNVSRLQNMADTAVKAGAEVLVNPLKNGELTDYTYGYLLPKIPNTAALTKSDRTTAKGDAEAKKYIVKNLPVTAEWKGNKINDDYNDSELTFVKNLYEKTDDDYKPLYYEVVLTEKHNHLFKILDSLDTVISVKSVAKFTHNKENDSETPDKTLAEQMEDIKNTKVYTFFEDIKHEYELIDAKKKAELIAKYIEQGYSQQNAEELATNDMGTKSAFQKAEDRSVQTSGNYWDSDKLNNYRTESSTLRGIGGATWRVDQYNIDDLFINFEAEVQYVFPKDWDLDSEYQPSGISYLSSNKIFDGKSDPNKVRYKLRIHSLIGVESARNLEGTKSLNKFPYKVRAGKDAPDPLYARIESETIKRNKYNAAGHKSFNSVHQIIINVTFPNTAADDRPIIFFYDGPEKIDENSSVRNSKPLILNLNADFRGVIYAPNSPVVVSGNNHSFEGFIVAKEFVKLKTKEEFETAGYKKVVRKDNNDEIFVKPDDIKSSDSDVIPANCIELNYSGGDSGKFYYIEKTCEYFTKITEERIDGKPGFRRSVLAEMYIDRIGNVQLSGEIFATVNGTDKAKNSDTPDKVFATAADFNLKSSKFNSFLLLKMTNYDYLNKSGGIDNFFTYSRATQID